MGFQLSWRLYLLLMLFTIKVKGLYRCTIEDKPKIDGYCTALIECRYDVYFNLKSRDWDCILHNDYDSSNDYYDTYDSTYNLIIIVKEPRSPEGLFLIDDTDNIVELSLEDGSLLSIPEEIYKMSRLKNISLPGNQISTVKLYNFLPMHNLKNINLTNNLISVIEVDSEMSTSVVNQSNVEGMDMSHNKIKELPNNFLSTFNQLQSLNLSHNMISSIGLLTFEGISQLKILDLSYNKLAEVGNEFASFISLENLVISNNYITKLDDFSFVTLTNLVKLNASSNGISEIKNKTFQSLINLEDLDLSHNKIEIITDQIFKSNTNLSLLLLSNNRIQQIEPNSFVNNKIEVFSIQNNNLLGVLSKNTFKQLNIDHLNLDRGNLTCINDDAFTDMSELKMLNISSNAINNISNLAFSSLTSLQILDLSQNQLNDLSFDSTDLKNLSKLFANHNKIKKISENVFKNFDSLIELDLSYNELQELESRCFFNINNLEILTVTGSNFVHTLDRKVFEGLTSVRKIDLSETRTTRFKNESFSGLVALTSIYSDFGQLSDIEYNAFLGTGSLEKLLLSNNQLRQFHINTSTILHVQEINLYNNLISNVSSETFSRLTLLRNLNLAKNDIITLASDVFLGLGKLILLDLSLNLKMSIIGNPFQKLSKLNKLSLNSLKTNITFENSSARIEILQLQSCSITDINKINIYNVQDLAYLYLRSNEIESIDKDSFKNMPSLVSLDLSMNKIMHIQPGSFLHAKNLEILNLFGNNMQSIQFGVFDGLKVLQELTLSSNAVSYLEIKSLPAVTKLYLDDNNITDLDFEQLFHSKITMLSIGGNQILCKTLAEVRSSHSPEISRLTITAEKLNYHSENVDGISCRNISNNKSSTVPENRTFDFSPLVTSLRNYIDKFGKSVETIANQYTIKNESVNSETKNATKLLEYYMNSSHHIQITSYDYLTKLTNIGNNSNIQFEEINNYMNNLTGTLQELWPDGKFNNSNLSDSQDIWRSEFKQLLEQENKALREELKIAMASITTKLSSQESHVLHESPNSNLGESKAVFYFIAICLAILVVAFISNIVFSYFMK